jgi:YD repeat-containing protein
VAGPSGRPRLDGREIVGTPARFYRRHTLGGDVCGVWVGGQPLYDVSVHDSAGNLLGVVDPEGAIAQDSYDDLRRALVAELIREEQRSSPTRSVGVAHKPFRMLPPDEQYAWPEARFPA